MLRSRVVALAVILLLGGCAKLTHSAVSSFDDPDGIPYYEGTHYVVVYSDGKGGIVWKLLFLADENKKRVAKPTSIFANLRTTLTFDHGVLGQSKAVGDSTAIPRAVIQAIEKLAPALAAANAARMASHQLPAPVLYRATWTNDMLELVGGPSKTPISVTLVRD